LDRIVTEFLETLLEFRLLASVSEVSQLLAEAGVTTREGRPVKAPTLSKALSRAQAKSTDSNSSPEGGTGGDRSNFTNAGGSPHATDGGDLRRAAANGGAQRRGLAANGSPRRPVAIRDDKWPNAAESGKARQTAAIEGKARRQKALAGGTRPAKTANGGSSSRAADHRERKTPPPTPENAAATDGPRNQRTRDFEATLARGAQLNSVMEKNR
jgi:hypothetical protein